VVIDYSSKQIVATRLLILQGILLKNEATGLCCTNGQVKLLTIAYSAKRAFECIQSSGKNADRQMYTFSFGWIKNFQNAFQDN